MSKISKAEQEEARDTLRELLPPGSTVYTVLRHVSRSGMSRDIDCYVIEDNQPRWISSLVAKATGIPFNAKAEALRVGGCGMDMGFHVVYELSHYLYQGGFGCIGEKCPSNDHSNGDRDYTPHDDGTPRNAEEVGKHREGYRHYHNSGGYALRHRWM